MFATGGILRERMIATAPIGAVDASGGSPVRAIQRMAQFGKFSAYRLAWETLTSGAVRQQATVTINTDASYFEVQRLAALADNYGAGLELQITPAGQQFFTRGIRLSHLGSGRLPIRLFHPGQLILQSNGTIITGFLSDWTAGGQAQNAYIALFGQKVYSQPLIQETWYTQAAPFFYRWPEEEGATAQPVPLTANQAAVSTIRTSGDADFDIQKMTVTADGPVTLNVQTASDYWFETDLRFELLGGSNPENSPDGSTGEYPFILPAPRLVQSANGITVRVTDISGLPTNRVEVVFHGTKLYPAGGARVAVDPQSNKLYLVR